jgi:transcriptional regulator with XRE-family HTH domain
MDQTTTNHRNGTFLAPIVTFTMLLGVGTGGDYTPGYHSLRSEKGAFSKPRERLGTSFAIAIDIEHTKSTLKLTMSELARCLGVSRQALYNWAAGGSIKSENLAKLTELRLATDVLSESNFDLHPRVLYRKLPGGKTLLEMITSGGNGAEAARLLVEMLAIEAEQRATLARRFEGRHPTNPLGHGMPPLTDQS